MARAIFGGVGGASGIDAMYKFDPLPLNQAEAVNFEEVYAIDFDGAANSHETGVYYGDDPNMIGGNLVLTQYGGVGTDGANRVIQDGTFQSFHATTAFYNVFNQSPAGWSCLLRNKNVNGNLPYLMNLVANDGAGNQGVMDLRLFKNNATFMTLGSHDGVSGIGSGVSVPPSNAWFYKENTPYQYLFSQDYVNGLSFCGCREDDGKFPTKIGDFQFFAINPFAASFDGPSTITTYHQSGIYKCIIGSFAQVYGSNYSGGQTLVSLVMSKAPCFTIA